MAEHEYRDALTDGPLKGRGATNDPGNRFEPVRLYVLGEHLDTQMAEAEHGEGAPAPRQTPTTVLPDRTTSLINRVDSPDLPFTWTINPYRGCEHGCIYCYARPTHEYLGMTSGVDFETKVMAKHDAPDLLRRELGAKKWRGDTLAMSGVTDCYQPIERELNITRGCMEVMAECRQPVGIVTKNRLVLRDLDLIQQLGRFNACAVAISVTTLDPKLAQKMEPRASSPKDRLQTIAALKQAGVPVAAMVAPIIPGLNDRETPSILEAVADAGATWAGYVLLRLPWQIKDLFTNWLDTHFPDRAGKVRSLIEQTHAGKLYDARYGVRQRGEGPIADQIATMFKVYAKRYRLDRHDWKLTGEHFRRPGAKGQMSLF